MAHTFEIDLAQGILCESFVGVVDYHALTEANKAVVADPGFKKGLDFLTDLREAESTLSYEEMAMHVSALPHLGTRRQAFVVGSDYEFGMARMFEMLSAEKGLYQEVRIFRDLDQALEWLLS